MAKKVRTTVFQNWLSSHSVAELTEMLGVTRQQIYKYLSEGENPSDDLKVYIVTDVAKGELEYNDFFLPVEKKDRYFNQLTRKIFNRNKKMSEKLKKVRALKKDPIYQMKVKELEEAIAEFNDKAKRLSKELNYDVSHSEDSEAP